MAILVVSECSDDHKLSAQENAAFWKLQAVPSAISCFGQEGTADQMGRSPSGIRVRIRPLQPLLLKYG